MLKSFLLSVSKFNIQNHSQSILGNKIAFSFSFKERFQKRQEKVTGDEFKKEIESLANKPSFTLNDFRMRVIDTLSKQKKGLKSYFMASNEINEIGLITNKKIMNSFTDEELNNHELVTSEVKKDVAIIADVLVADVNTTLLQFENMKLIQKWLRDLKEANQPLPNSHEEMMARMRMEKPKVNYFFKLKMRKPRMSSRQNYQRIKWGKYKAY